MNLTDRVKSILLQPAEEWRVIEQETGNASELYKSYIAPLAALGPVASIIGLPMIVGDRVPLTAVVAHAFVGFILTLASTYVFSLIINALAPTFQGTKNNFQALKLTAYSSTPAWLAGIFNLIPALSFLQVLGLYSLYLLYTGLPPLMRAPQEKALPYTVVVILASIVIFAVIGAISSCFFLHPGPA
ncbi:MAG: Yip1 family protein [Candidatus Binatia bacterium]